MGIDHQNILSVAEVSVVVCVLNEESRIKDCLKTIKKNLPGEIIVVDGGSKDDTVKIATTYADKVIISTYKSLSRDRQLGIDSAKHSLIVMGHTQYLWTKQLYP